MPQDTFESRRQKHTAAGGACCQRGNILLFILIGVIMFYVAFGIHMYVGPPMVRENSKELLSKYNSESGNPPAVSVAQRSGFRGPQEDRMVILSSAVPDKSVSSTIAADGIDDAVTAIVRCATSQGNLTIDVRGRWAPLGSEQFLKLVEAGMFTDLPFFRVCPRYISKIFLVFFFVLLLTLVIYQLSSGPSLAARISIWEDCKTTSLCGESEI